LHCPAGDLDFDQAIRIEVCAMKCTKLQTRASQQSITYAIVLCTFCAFCARKKRAYCKPLI
jgi:hypothetical protein